MHLLFLNGLSATISALFGIMVLYQLLDLTVGKLKILHSKKEWHGFQLKDAFFFAAAALFLFTCFDFYKPY